MDKDQLIAHLKTASKQGFVSKFERETFCKLNDWGEREGFRLYLRGFSMWEIKEYLIG